MIDRDRPPDRLAPGLFAIGHGWLPPAVLLFAFIAIAYLPTHPVGGSGVVAAAGAIYVVSMMVVLPRVARGLVLRRAGLAEPIVLLGRGSNVLQRPALSPWRRLAAIASGALVSAVAAIGALVLLAGLSPDTYPHAIGTVALATNLVLLLGAVTPIPGFGGWAALLALADLRGVGAEGRVSQAAAWTRVAALVLIAGSMIGGVVTGDPMAISIGLLLGAVAWQAARAALGVDAAERFFARHSASDLTRPLTAVRQVDDLLVDLGPVARGAPALVLDTGGALVGVIGPRQLRAAERSAVARCSDVMVPIRALSLTSASAPASNLLAGLATHGFAVVRGDSGISVADADDVGRQLRIWSLVAGWGRGRRSTPTNVAGSDEPV